MKRILLTTSLLALLAMTTAPSVDALSAGGFQNARCYYHPGNGLVETGWYASSHAYAHSSGGLTEVGGHYSATATAEGVTLTDAGSWPMKNYATADVSFPDHREAPGYTAVASSEAHATAVKSRPVSYGPKSEAATCETDTTVIGDVLDSVDPGGIIKQPPRDPDCQLQEEDATLYYTEDTQEDGNSVFVRLLDGSVYGWPSDTDASGAYTIDSWKTTLPDAAMELQTMKVIRQCAGDTGTGHISVPDGDYAGGLMQTGSSITVGLAGASPLDASDLPEAGVAGPEPDAPGDLLPLAGHGFLHEPLSLIL